MESLVYSLNPKLFGILSQVHFDKMYHRKYTQHSSNCKILSQCKQVTLRLLKAPYSIYDPQRRDHMSSLMTFINRYHLNLTSTNIGLIEKLTTYSIGSPIQVALKKHQFFFQELPMLFSNTRNQKITQSLNCSKLIQTRAGETLYKMVQIPEKLLTSVRSTA